MKRIGFIDHNLENFHANTFLNVLRNDLKKRGFTITGCYGTQKKQSRDWATQNKVPYFTNLHELNEAVDHYMILAPSNPETHLELCQKIFPFGKPTYVDKTFAPDLKTAQKIFALADKHKVPMQTSSALRYTEIQDYAQSVGQKNIKHMTTWVAGRSFGEYAIHPIEMFVSCMGPNVTRLMRRGTQKQVQLILDLTNNRTAIVNVFPNTRTPNSASITTHEETRYFAVDRSKLFVNAASAILDLFETKKAHINRKESLIIRRIQDVAEQKRSYNKWVNL
ncbi:MAG: Gfo/Idh/MocA family oxidoreductase [Candidatus Latescibacterota bacterium]